MKYKESDYYDVIQLMLRRFTLSNFSDREFTIFKELIKSVDNNSPLTIEELSFKANLSQPSISRFVRRLGFKNYFDFKMNFFEALIFARFESEHEYKAECLSEFIDKGFNNIINNLDETKKNLNFNLLDNIVKDILDHKNILFLGGMRELSHFLSFRKEMIIQKTPCYFFYDVSTQRSIISECDASFYVIIVSLDTSELHYILDILKVLKEKEIKTVLFCQDINETYKEYFSSVYIYGNKKDLALGHYSLSYIATILLKIYLSKIYE